MEFIFSILHLLLHIDNYLFKLIAEFGYWTYGILFVVIFCETGLVVTPFLPGDSLLFAAGSIAANPLASLNIIYLFLLLTLASIMGNHLNYLIGKIIGPRVFTKTNSYLLNKKYLVQAHQFYEKHGGKTILLARYIPIVRTFVPFVAGAANMSSYEFSFYNVLSALLWIGSLLSGGYFLGSFSWVKENFSLVLYSIIGFSLLLPILTFFYRKYQTLNEHS